MRSKEIRSLPTVSGLTSRREVLWRGAVIAGVAVIAPVWTRRARAQTASTTFDYYISTHGSDSNPGTLAAPWAITSLQRENSNNARMKGKRVGLLPGVYGIYSLWNTRSLSTDPLLSVPSGTSSAWTYLGSSDASGNYSPRTATITASPSGTPGGGLPGSSSDTRSIIGQSYTDAGGYMEIDGIIVCDGQCWGIFVTGGWGNVGGPPFTISNCEVYNIGGTEGNNVAGIMTYNTTGTLIRNNLVHDVTVSAGGQNGHNFAGLFSQDSLNHTYEYNTVYNCNSCIYDKNGNNGGHTYRYNYLECNGPSPFATVTNSGGGQVGQTRTVHHNIFVIAPGSSNNNVMVGFVDNGPNTYSPYESLDFYNNTIYVLSGGAFLGGLTWQSQGNNVSQTASVTHYNNIYVSAAPGYMGTLNLGTASGAVALTDYNAYAGGCSSKLGTGSGFALTNSYTLANWQSAFSRDTHSLSPTASQVSFTNPGVARTATGYQLQSGSSCRGAGRVGGTAGGAAVDMGAWGGTDVNTGGPVTQIGCSFIAGSSNGGTTTSPPKAPVLTVS